MLHFSVRSCSRNFVIGHVVNLSLDTGDELAKILAACIRSKRLELSRVSRSLGLDARCEVLHDILVALFHAAISADNGLQSCPE
jgi:hypothetical protein